VSVAEYFSDVAKAKAQGGGQHVKGEGDFTLTIQRIFVNDGFKGKFFVCEFTIDESTSAQDPAGCTRSWVAPLTGERAKYSFGDIKNLIFALTGQNPRDAGTWEENPALHNEAAEIVKAACDPAYAKKNNLDPTLLIGERVRLSTHAKATRPKPGQTQGGTFTVHTWSPLKSE